VTFLSVIYTGRRHNRQYVKSGTIFLDWPPLWLGHPEL